MHAMGTVGPATRGAAPLLWQCVTDVENPANSWP